MQDNLLWRYSLAVYQREGVANILLRLQDKFSADINLLLCCCWLGQKQRLLSVVQVTELEAVTANWRQQCLIPLRAIRRYVKTEVGQDELYQQFKSLELMAERRQQDLLVARLDRLELSGSPGDVKYCIHENLRAYITLLPESQSQQLLRLVEKLMEVISCSTS